MEAYALEWVNLLLRWAHVVVAVAWIGSSFYFVFLDNSLTKPLAAKGDGPTPDGELWAVHGGGFYHPQKYLVAPPAMPENLHWFYWESYSTWLTGFGLFSVLYLAQAKVYLIDANVFAWSSPAAAVAAALGFLVVFWLAYDAVCRVLGPRPGGERWVGLVTTLLVALAAVLACQWFAARAAFLIVGAMLATAMSANVFFWIIPGQRTVVAQLKAGQSPDPIYGQRAKQRSVHNTYFTLPVLAAMLSNHAGFLTTAPNKAAVLLLLMLAGALIRHVFVARHKALVQGRRVPWEFAGAGVVILLGLFVALAPAQQTAPAATLPPPSFAQVRAVVEQRCVVCHNAVLASKAIQLHTPELIAKNASALYQQAVVLKAMPMNNATQITDAERALLGRWVEAGAPLQ